VEIEACETRIPTNLHSLQLAQPLNCYVHCTKPCNRHAFGGATSSFLTISFSGQAHPVGLKLLRKIRRSLIFASFETFQPHWSTPTWVWGHAKWSHLTDLRNLAPEGTPCDAHLVTSSSDAFKGAVPGLPRLKGACVLHTHRPDLVTLLVMKTLPNNFRKGCSRGSGTFATPCGLRFVL